MIEINNSIMSRSVGVTFIVVTPHFSVVWVCILLLQVNTSFIKFIQNLTSNYVLKFEMDRSNNSENFGSDDLLDTPLRLQVRRTVSSMVLSRYS